MKIPVAHQSVEPCSSIALRRTVVGTMDHGAPMPACLVLLFVRSPSVHESSTSCYLTVDMDLELPIALCLWTQQALPLAARTMHMIIADPYEPYQPSKSGSFFFWEKAQAGLWPSFSTLATSRRWQVMVSWTWHKYLSSSIMLCWPLRHLNISQLDLRI